MQYLFYQGDKNGVPIDTYRVYLFSGNCFFFYNSFCAAQPTFLKSVMVMFHSSCFSFSCWEKRRFYMMQWSQMGWVPNLLSCLKSLQKNRYLGSKNSMWLELVALQGYMHICPKQENNTGLGTVSRVFCLEQNKISLFSIMNRVSIWSIIMYAAIVKGTIIALICS